MSFVEAISEGQKLNIKVKLNPSKGQTIYYLDVLPKEHTILVPYTCFKHDYSFKNIFYGIILCFAFTDKFVSCHLS